MSDGYLSVTNHGTGTLTIERVTLAAPRSIKFLGAYIVPVTHNVVGDFDGWPPPPSKLLPGVMWAQRHRPAGARVRPGESIDSVVGLKIAAGHAKASDSGQLIYYRDSSGHQYVTHSQIRVTLETGHGACSG